ncbi:MAG: hypothetical protein ACK559_23635, partial [bacterium]
SGDAAQGLAGTRAGLLAGGLPPVEPGGCAGGALGKTFVHHNGAAVGMRQGTGHRRGGPGRRQGPRAGATTGPPFSGRWWDPSTFRMRLRNPRGPKGSGCW